MTPLKRLLFEKQLTHRWLAQQVGMTETAISLVINGKRVPSLENALRIAKVLETSVEALWGFVIED
ncbi:helix-turn-helix transcriptional regulator [Alicyclobacillus pomorum]|uniref:helix-turn-helix transcriptional regulator n=1 Tax=Alicyclobacillus pomorum TaxID=204470 RepID=UPI001B7FC4D7|nr:helix-turn-helix transcriptional regulator [Alicyclobacillus pomorum]